MLIYSSKKMEQYLLCGGCLTNAPIFILELAVKQVNMRAFISSITWSLRQPGSRDGWVRWGMNQFTDTHDTKCQQGQTRLKLLKYSINFTTVYFKSKNFMICNKKGWEHPQSECCLAEAFSWSLVLALSKLYTVAKNQGCSCIPRGFFASGRNICNCKQLPSKCEKIGPIGS